MQVLQEAGIELQPAHEVYAVTEPIVVAHKGATLALHPLDADELKISFTLKYEDDGPIGRQARTDVITPENFVIDLADAHTYIFEAEAAELRRQGLGTRTKVTDLLVFGPGGPIDNPVRHADEPVRHKILDLVGDLAARSDTTCAAMSSLTARATR